MIKGHIPVAPTKKTWLDLAVSIGRYHAERLKANEHWRVEDTAKELKYSIGTVSQYLAIASWMRTHENQLRRLNSLRDALAYIKKHKKDLVIGSLE